MTIATLKKNDDPQRMSYSMGLKGLGFGAHGNTRPTAQGGA